MFTSSAKIRKPRPGGTSRCRRHNHRQNHGPRRPSDFHRSRRHDHPYSRPTPGRGPSRASPIRQFADVLSHDARGIDHFGFMYQGDLRAFCDELRAKGVAFPVELKKGVGGSLLCYVAAPDGVSIELMQC
ncbi:MAG TPA: VOC family protein [Bradyrhizobium sp.]